jgi:hypothetical protein
LPALFDLLRGLGFITQELAVLGLFGTGALIALVRDWRVTLLALLGQYVMTGLILSRLVLPEIALIKMLIGALICPMLYLAARQSGWWLQSLTDASVDSQRTKHPENNAGVFRVGLSFRLLAVALVLVITVVLNQTYPLPNIPPDVGLGAYWLMLIGLLILMLTEEPLKAGPGLLIVITGFELLYTSLEPSLAIVFLWAVVNLMLAVAIAYLSVVQGFKATEKDL